MYVLEKDSNQYNLMGGKATALAKLGLVIDNIPDWFVVSYTGFDIDKKKIVDEAKKEIEERLKSFNKDDYFAVRSSAVKEDSSQNSFAGQFDTFLYIKRDEVIDKVLEVYLSGFSDRINAYKKENNIDDITVPSAIVQRMVMSEKAGVAFGANPVNSNIKEQVVTAVYGLGSSLVDGVATSDTYTISSDDVKKEIATKDYYHEFDGKEVVQKEVEDNLKKKQILKEKEII